MQSTVLDVKSSASAIARADAERFGARRELLAAGIDIAILGLVAALAWRGVLSGGFAGIILGSLVGTRAATLRAKSPWVSSSAVAALLIGLWSLLSVRADRA